MANLRRGEIDASLDGRTYTLCLTLGALAELEDAFKVDDLMALADRFEKGQLSARDIAILIGCGLRGGGHDIANDDVMKMQAEDGIAGFAQIAHRLLAATFGSSNP